MHMIRALLRKQADMLEIPDMQHCSRNNGEFVVENPPLPPCRSIFLPFRLTTKSRDALRAPDHPPMREQAFLSLRPRQIMIALISVDSRLSVLSRDIVTRQHEGQDNSQKSLSAVGTDEN